jgi:hypothetical protein
MHTPQQLTFPRVDRKRYENVGLCIYCGATGGLTDEHIIPYGLGGNLILPDSTCEPCAKITSGIERTILRGPFRPIRVVRGIQSRRRHRDAPTALPLKLRRGEEWETIYLPYDEYPLLLDFLVFDVPGRLDPEYQSGIRIRGHMTFSFGPQPEEVMKRFGANDIRISQTHTPTAFAKMTAKVAYAMAVALGAIDPSRGRPNVVRSILGQTDDVGYWVGTITEPRRWIANVLHSVAVERDAEKGLLIGRVQYLTDTGTPQYGVILGDLDDGFVNPAA